VQLAEHVISDSVKLIINKDKLERACCEKLYVKFYACAITSYSADNS